MSGRFRSVWLSWAALVALLAATTGLAYVPLGRAALPAALAVASVKAAVIVLVFMELARATGLTRIAAGAGLFWLCVLLGMPAIDYLNRAARPVTERTLDTSVIPPPRR